MTSEALSYKINGLNGYFLALACFSLSIDRANSSLIVCLVPPASPSSILSIRSIFALNSSSASYDVVRKSIRRILFRTPRPGLSQVVAAILCQQGLGGGGIAENAH